MKLNELRDRAYATAKSKGWYDKPATFGDRMALIHSEVSEALEDFRAGKKPNEVFYTRKGYAPSGEVYEVVCTKDHPDAKPCGIAIELADVLIRILDLSGLEGIDIQAAVEEKMAYNDKRPYRHGGKAL